MLQRLPIPALRPFVALVWASEGDGPVTAGPGDQTRREHVLPTGMMHLVVRLSDSPLRIAGPLQGSPTQRVSAALVGGARSRFYVRELSAPSHSVGALLRPGAAQCLFGVDACELAERHTSLEDLWLAPARTLREQLIDTRGGAGRLAVLEAALMARLPRVRSLHPAIASALGERPDGAWSVADAVRRSGVSHRHFIRLFQQTVGLPPKTWVRVQRFQQALSALRQDSSMPLSTVALDMGYSDQSHFNRDFRDFTGVTPLGYRQHMGVEMNHLPVDDRPVFRT